MREIKYTNQFQKDYRKCKRGDNSTRLDLLLAQVVSLSQADIPIDKRHQDNALKGKLQGFRECHIKPYLLLIYSKPNNNELILIRLGSHSDLF